MRRLLPLLTLSAVLVSSAAIAAPRHRCPAGLHPATTAELFFGRSMPGAGQVSEADWTKFVDTVVTPRFPDGLSVNDVYGQWTDPMGQFVREQTKAMFIVLSGARGDRPNLNGVRQAYMQRFHQQSVMLVVQDACVGF